MPVFVKYRAYHIFTHEKSQNGVISLSPCPQCLFCDFFARTSTNTSFMSPNFSFSQQNSNLLTEFQTVRLKLSSVIDDNN